MKGVQVLLCICLRVGFSNGYSSGLVQIYNFENSVYVASTGLVESNSPLRALNKTLYFDPNFYDEIAFGNEEEEQEVVGKGKVKGFLVEYFKYNANLMKVRLMKLFFTNPQYFFEGVTRSILSRTV